MFVGDSSMAAVSSHFSMICKWGINNFQLKQNILATKHFFHVLVPKNERQIFSFGILWASLFSNKEMEQTDYISLYFNLHFL